MDLKKPLKFDLKLSFDKDLLKGDKKTIVTIGLGFILSIILIVLISDQYGNFSKFTDAQARHQKLIDDKTILEKNIKQLVAKSPEYFNNLSSAPKNKAELTDALTKLIAKNNIKLIKLSTNESNATDPKNNTIELEIDGTYGNISRFSESMSSIVISSEILTFKINKKEGSSLHLSMMLKFVEPPIKNQLKQVSHDIRPNIMELYQAQGWSLVKAGFVPAQPESQITNQKTPEITQNESAAATNKSSSRDPFDPSGASFSESEGNNKTSSSKSGFYLSGILYSENSKYCVVSVPGGHTKIFSEGENLSPNIKIISIENDHIIVTSTKRPKLLVGEEAIR
jgi:hypothetical protein